MKNVLWLASWYPNRLDKFDGDFIQRHARAVALYCKVHVIYVKKDENLAVNTSSTESYDWGNLTEQVIYYNSPKTGIGLFDKFLSHQNYKKYYRIAIREYIKNAGKPGLVHVHVAMKAGIAARWVKKKWGIPFIVSEHVTTYLKDADLRIEHFPFLFKRNLYRVMQEAVAITVVSKLLGRSIQNYFPGTQFIVIPNVVDTSVFFPENRVANEVSRFIHISNMNFQKNTGAILLSLKLLKQTNSFEMYLYGPKNRQIEEMIVKYDLGSCVFVMGEMPQPELAKAIQRSDALIQYSQFETFGCVLIEANACGIPAIVSDIEVFHELINEGINGIFVEKDNPAALAEILRKFISQKNNFDRIAIAGDTAEKYNFKKVGQLFIDLYNDLPVISKN